MNNPAEWVPFSAAFEFTTRNIAGYVFFPVGTLLSAYQLSKHRFKYDMYWPLIIWMGLWTIIWGVAFPPKNSVGNFFLIWLIGFLGLYSVRSFAKKEKDKTAYAFPKWLMIAIICVLGILVTAEVTLRGLPFELFGNFEFALVYFFFLAQVVYLILTFLHAQDRIALEARKGEGEFALIEEIGQKAS